MTKHTLDSLADEVRGCTAAEIVAAAKEHGFMPDAAGLIEFPKPVMYLLDDETGEELPCFDIVSVEDAQPEPEPEQAATVAPANVGVQQWQPYRWVRPNAVNTNFGYGTHYPPRHISGHVGNAVNAVRLQPHGYSGIAYSARTYYHTRALGYNAAGNHSQWSPIRISRVATSRLLAFSSTVYANTAEVW